MKKIFELLRLMCPYQWVKNAFVFTGLLFGHAWHDPHLVTQVIVVFIAFCLVSSAIYTINDIVDVEQKRYYSKGQQRKLSMGQASIIAMHAVLEKVA